VEISPSEAVPGLVVGFWSAKTLTPVIPFGRSQVNVVSELLYQPSGSGCVVELISGASGVAFPSGVLAIEASLPVAFFTTLTVAVPRDWLILVP
jgi:hypothetical protein